MTQIRAGDMGKCEILRKRGKSRLLQYSALFAIRFCPHLGFGFSGRYFWSGVGRGVFVVAGHTSAQICTRIKYIAAFRSSIPLLHFFVKLWRWGNTRRRVKLELNNRTIQIIRFKDSDKVLSPVPTSTAFVCCPYVAPR